MDVLFTINPHFDSLKSYHTSYSMWYKEIKLKIVDIMGNSIVYFTIHESNEILEGIQGLIHN